MKAESERAKDNTTGKKEARGSRGAKNAREGFGRAVGRRSKVIIGDVRAAFLRGRAHGRTGQTTAYSIHTFDGTGATLLIPRVSFAIPLCTTSMGR